MTPSRGSVYQDPNLPGSLVAALRAWQALAVSGRSRDLQQLAFTLSCSNASLAHNVAWFLHGRPVCEATTVTHFDRGDREEWHVTGTTRRQLQSLSNLERLFTWLRVAASNHQVHLRLLTV